MNTNRKTLAVLALAGGMALATGAFAKAHDNGVADGSPSGNPSIGGQTADQGGNAISAGQKDGARGINASGLGAENSAGKGNSPN